MIEIQLKTSNHPEINQEMIYFAVSKTLVMHDKANADVTIRFTDDDEMHRLNQSFKDMDKTTDVLSFNQDITDPETGRFYLGDVVISLDRAFLQAQENSHTLNIECALLAIHGTLHLLGYDHELPEDETKMWELQDRILSEAIHAFRSSANEKSQ